MQFLVDPQYHCWASFCFRLCPAELGTSLDVGFQTDFTIGAP